MTILQAIVIILKQYPEGLSSKEITSKIIEQNLYEFNTPTPISVVNQELRRHCQNVDFPAARPYKCFYIAGKKDIRGKNKYILLPEAFHDFSKSENNYSHNTDISTQNNDTDNRVLSNEILQKYYTSLISNIKLELLNKLLKCNSDAFQNIIVILLKKLGYIHESSFIKEPRNIDTFSSIFKQDTLGLDVIYVKANRNSSKRVIQLADLQHFAGEMGSINKGIYISTSTFSESAQEYVNSHTEKHISLIGKDLLLELMIKNKVGICVVGILELTDIDTDLFETY